jgi:hypothetical protein
VQSWVGIGSVLLLVVAACGVEDAPPERLGTRAEVSTGARGSENAIPAVSKIDRKPLGVDWDLDVASATLELRARGCAKT